MPSIHIGRQITGPDNERYVIVDFLGHGAFGEVYRATGEKTGAVLAVKLLPVGQLPDETGRRALLNEVRAAQQINHPNVIRVLHVDEGSFQDLGPYVCMEYVSGGTLARLLRVQNQTNSQIPLPRTIEMMIDIAQGARAINEKLVHRDLKPDNVLIEGSTLKIGDFGISKFVDESTRLHTFKGGQHVAYMAPEGWKNERNTFKIDVYAAGIMFFEILTLSHPLAPKVRDPGSLNEWEQVHLYETIPDLRNLRHDAAMPIIQLIPRMAAKRPQDRPNWDEVLRILSDPAVDAGAARNAVISEAVAAAVAQRQQEERRSLEMARKAEEAETGRRLYGHSCQVLLERFRPAVEQFNREFQFGSITAVEERGFHYWPLPSGNTIEVIFFAPHKTGIKIRGSELLGGGWIGLRRGRSANLILLKESADDLYGRWIICEVKLMALVDPSSVIGKFGITERTVEPFGFNDANFYDQIAYAQGGMHIFTYHFDDDVEGYFALLIAEGCKYVFLAGGPYKLAYNEQRVPQTSALCSSGNVISNCPNGQA